MENKGISLKSVTTPLKWLESEGGIKREKAKVKERGVHKI